MISSRLPVRALPVAASLALLGAPAGALAAPDVDNGVLPGAMMGRTVALAPYNASHHNGPSGHLPPARENMEVVGRLQLDQPFGDVAPAQIADVSVLKDTAYLASWATPADPDTGFCERGGFFAVDISDPSRPRQLAFRNALPRNYHGEGMHAVSVRTDAFQGDLLAVNNETCADDNADVERGGGFDLWDVSNPADPQPLSRANGDYGEDNASVSMTGTASLANEAHSVFLWQDGGKAYAVLVDNQDEFDLDIYDVTNPRAVQPVSEFDLNDEARRPAGFPELDEDDDGLGAFPSNSLHDMVVKEINGVQTMLVSYWDSGYVTLNVEDPANPRYIADSDFGATDPLTGYSPPEGNAHQAEFTHDNRHILAADEDFDAYRLVSEVNGQPAEFGFGIPVTATSPPQAIPELLPSPGDPIEGDTRFVGEACTLASIPAPQAGETIAVAERGTCDFDLKSANASDRGYEAILIFNNVLGAAPRCEQILNMTWDDPNADIKSLFIPREIGMRIIDAYDPATYRCERNDPTSTPTPAPNRAGLPVKLAVEFDGWGYAHIFRNNPGKLEKRGDYAIPEALDERYAAESEFGVTSIHEWATDPSTNLAYASYYSGGMRVARYDDNGIQEVGRFIAEEGSNFWGVEQFTGDNCERLIAGSDRDYGLYILRYTGPGAVTGPCPTPPPGPKAGRCTNLRAVTAGQRLTGADVGEQITGTESADTVDAGGGDDCVDGLGGNDDLRGGPGVDAIDGQRGNDRLRGDRGRGNLRGGTGNDRISGNRSGDVLFGNTGNDRLDAGRRADQLFGGAGRDRLTGGGGKDVIEAGTGNDRIFARDGAVDMIDCGFGRDTVVSRDRKDKLASCESKAKLR